MTDRLDAVAVVGLGVMGSNLARNFASRSLDVGGFDLDVEGARAMAARHPEANLRVAASLAEMVAGLERPRRIVLLVNAGRAVDAVIEALDPLLEADDIVVDGGNSLYTDTDRRNALADTRPWRFVGMGVSGGSEGALKGPSMMPGGDPEAWTRLKPVLESIAAQSASGACVTHCGRGSAGHFVKMVHNGIEYGDMQLIAETATLLRRGLGLSAAEVADVFEEWNRGELESFLIEITADIFRFPDPQKPGEVLVDAILDQAGQKGTGRWTVLTAVELGVPVPTIAAAVDARALSSFRAIRAQGEAAYGRPERRLELSVDDLRDALYASKIASYSQGFSLLAAASHERGYGTDLGEVARIWTAGCIIRARFLDRIRDAFGAPDAPDLLALAPSFVEDLRGRVPAWRRVVSQASLGGFAAPGFAASLGWFDSLTTARGSASVIQAQRDYFGSHTYRRVEDPDTAIHTEWAPSQD
ncbi:MAG: NADP-dependent phosphogluconate dehydrogenase [Sandaracinaceae bacterium]|nr:NADP-dependent phosphogluconate dehydrogenase [Sandaracinaceae bacterium]